MENNEDNGKFYRERSWQLLVDEIRGIKADLIAGLDAIKKDIADIKDRNIFGLGERITKVENRVYWIVGIGFGISFMIQIYQLIE